MKNTEFSGLAKSLLGVAESKPYLLSLLVPILTLSPVLLDLLTDAPSVRTAGGERLLPAGPAAFLQPAAAASAPPPAGPVPAGPGPAEVPAAAGERPARPGHPGPQAPRPPSRSARLGSSPLPVLLKKV